MSKGENVPGAVGYFGHTVKSNKGKAHPEGVTSGPSLVETYNRSMGPSTKAQASGARSTVPSGVVRGDGTETRKGITVKHLRVEPRGPSTAGSAGATPAGVRKFSGLSAPGKVK